MTRLLTFTCAMGVLVCALLFTAVEGDAVNFVEPHAAAVAALPPQPAPTPAG